MNTTAIEIARERQLDWLLAEVLGEPPRAAATSRNAWSARQWLAAAIAVLALGIAFAVAALRDPPTDRVAAQDPDDTMRWQECDRAHVDELPADVVNLRAFDFDDDALARLGRLTRLERLDLSCMRPDARGVVTAVPITDIGVEELAALTTLRWLSLAGCQQVKGNTLAALRAIPRLEHLDLTYTGVTSAGIAALPQLPSLRELSLSGCLDFHGRSLADVARIPGLRRLELHGCATVAAADVKQLARLHELRWLDLRDCMGAFRGQTEVGFDDITNGEPPDTPKQDGVGVTDDAVLALAGLPLETLRLGGCSGLTDAIGPSLAAMQDLRHLDLGDLPKVTAKLVAGLSPALRSLALDGNRRLDAAAFAALAHLRALEELGMNGVETLTDDVLRAVVADKPLKELRIGGTPRMGDALGPAAGVRPALTPAVAATLAAMPTLERLDASYAGWFDAKVAAAVAALPRLAALDLKSAAGSPAALRALGASRSLRVLGLIWAQGVTADGLRALADVPLRELDLYGVRDLGADDVRALATWPGCDVRLPDGRRFRVAERR